jgi:adenosylhomocysteine nucleosidase
MLGRDEFPVIRVSWYRFAAPLKSRPGIICSGDVFGMTESKLQDIRTKLKAELVEMEGAVIGQVCHELQLPHLVIRGGSNLAQENPGNDYKRLGQIAARSAALFTLHVLKQLPN